MGRTPIIVGVGDHINRSVRPEDAIEPLGLIITALSNAFVDASAGNENTAELLRQNVDSVDAVATWTWPYPDLPGLVAKKLGLSELKHKATSIHAGSQPAKLVDEAARRVAAGECNVAIVFGGEALASRTYM
jgi:acetyl-CoA acetyltransferase